MNDIPLTIYQVSAGLIILVLAIYMFLQQTKKQGDEVPDPVIEYKHYVKPAEDEPYNPMAIYPISDPEILKLEKYEKVYRHFNYVERYGLTFKDYLRKVEAGNMSDFEPTVTRSLNAHLA